MPTCIHTYMPTCINNGGNHIQDAGRVFPSGIAFVFYSKTTMHKRCFIVMPNSKINMKMLVGNKIKAYF